MYAWGGPWGTAVKAIPKGVSALLEIVWPKEGDTLPLAVKSSLKVQARSWLNGIMLGEGPYDPIVTNGTPATLTITSASTGASALVHVVFGDKAPAALTSRATWNFLEEPSFPLSYDLPVPSTKVTLSFAKLEDTTFSNIVAQVTYANQSAGLQQISLPNDGSISLPDGSYGVLLEYVPIWSQTAIQKVLTQIGPVDWSPLSVKRVFHGIPWGGPDSLEVQMPYTGILLLRSGSYQGSLLQGSWELYASGRNDIEVWKVGLNGISLSEENMRVSIKCTPRMTENAFSVKGNICIKWEGESSHRIEGFLSQVAMPFFRKSTGCTDACTSLFFESNGRTYPATMLENNEWPQSFPINGTLLVHEAKSSIFKTLIKK